MEKKDYIKMPDIVVNNKNNNLWRALFWELVATMPILPQVHEDPYESVKPIVERAHKLASVEDSFPQIMVTHDPSNPS